MEFAELSTVLGKMPDIETMSDTFFDIAGIQRREVSVSKAYNYFLNSGNKAIASLFLNSLAELIKSKTERDFFFKDFYSETEIITNRSKRIDIVISSREAEERKIIIENKIGAEVYNDLKEYWENFEIPDENKVAILLTIKSVGDKDDFINITHNEWVKKIKSKGLPVGLSLQQYVYLNDFFINMEKLTKHLEFTPEVKYTFENAKSIGKAVELYDNFIKFITSNISAVASGIGFKVQHNIEEYYSYIYKKDEDKIFYSVLYHQIFEGKNEITIVIEFWIKEYSSFADEVDLMLDSKNVDLANYKRYKENKEGQGSDWLHFLSKDYPLDPNNMENLGQFISNKIKSDFESIMNTILEFVESRQQQITPSKATL